MRGRRPVSAERFALLLDKIDACGPARRWSRGKDLRQVLGGLRRDPLKSSPGERDYPIFTFRWAGYLIAMVNDADDPTRLMGNYTKDSILDVIVLALSLPLAAWEDVVNDFLDGPGDARVNQETPAEETECPKREDKTHCVHWYDGQKECCSCGLPCFSGPSRP